jgi:hypothetical protein
MVTLVVVLATSCGGAEEVSSQGEVTATTASPTTAASGENDGGSDQADAVPGTPSVAVPTARFTAHGPDAPNTIGPACSDVAEQRGGDVFRFTPPASWSWKGTSGGTGPDEVSLTADDVIMYVTEASYDYETERLTGWTVVGPSGVDLDLGGESIPMMEITLDGADGYAIVDLPYLYPLPQLGDDGALGTVALTSDTPGRPTLDEARELLETVRIERCAAVGEALIWGPVAGVHLVPRVDPDPLGKPYPDQPQPAFEAAKSPLESYSLEQIAYLLPVEAGVAACVAEEARIIGAGNPIAYFQFFIPSGTHKEVLAGAVAGC